MLSGNIENVSIKEKAKFPQEFFPDVSISCDFIDTYIFLLHHLSHDTIVWLFYVISVQMVKKRLP